MRVRESTSLGEGHPSPLGVLGVCITMVVSLLAAKRPGSSNSRTQQRFVFLLKPV